MIKKYLFVSKNLQIQQRHKSLCWSYLQFSTGGLYYGKSGNVEFCLNFSFWMTISCLSLWQQLAFVSEKCQVIQRFQLQNCGSTHILHSNIMAQKPCYNLWSSSLFPFKIPYPFFTHPIQTTCAAISLFLINQLAVYM